MFGFLDIFAWVVLTVLLLVVVAAIVYVGSLPGNIAKKRNHPQVDAINAASWIGLALLGVGWPIAFVWAFLKQGPIGSDPHSPEDSSTTGTNVAGGDSPAQEANENGNELASIAKSLAAIDRRLSALEQKRQD